MSTIPESIAVEARAKIMWGEPLEKVRAFVMSKQIGEKEAAALLEEIISERAAVVRDRGMKKIWLGAFLTSGAVVYYFASHGTIGPQSVKSFSTLVIAAIVGVGLITDGLLMLLRPRALRGDLSNGAL